MTIPTTPILHLRDGRSIHITQEAGHIADGVDKAANPRRLSYAEGSPLLVDATGAAVCGPIDYQGIKLFALEVVCGNARANTEPAAAIRLATALLALMDTFEFAGAMDLAVPTEEPSHVGQ